MDGGDKGSIFLLGGLKGGIGVRRKFPLILGHFLLGNVWLARLGGPLLRGVRRSVDDREKDVMPVTDGVRWPRFGGASGGGSGVVMLVNWLRRSVEVGSLMALVGGSLGGEGESLKPK